jgi:3-oxoacyl-[acyl-carrier protein] reductase
MDKNKIKTILITGSSKGIGYETAKVFASDTEMGVEKVLLVARDSDHFSKAIETLQGLAPEKKVVGYALDVADHEGVIDVSRKVAAEHGNVDVLINNAGYTNPVPLHQIEFDDFQRTVAVNLYAPFTFIQELLFAGNKFTHIVNISSTAGMNGRSGWLTYSASKAAVINMSQVLREELSVYGTRVICLSPGRCATDLRRTLAPGEDLTTIMQPQEVAKVIRLMLTEGRYIDSENLVVRQ